MSSAVTSPGFDVVPVRGDAASFEGDEMGGEIECRNHHEHDEDEFDRRVVVGTDSCIQHRETTQTQC